MKTKNNDTAKDTQPKEEVHYATAEEVERVSRKVLEQYGEAFKALAEQTEGRHKIDGQTFEEERALYALLNHEVTNCVFAGAADGESPLKECCNLAVENCSFELRYPLWHCKMFAVTNCTLKNPCRAPLWYDSDGTLDNCTILGVKPLRECENIKVHHCKMDSSEVGWKCNGLQIVDSQIISEYFLLDSQNVTLRNITLDGKYSCQYLRNSTIENCTLRTKDAFWHAENVTVKNCKVEGEYLGWYAKNLTFENCEISGTQPLCYCSNLVLKNCTMKGCDLAFEYSDVNAELVGTVDSVKNPRSGKIVADGFGEIIHEKSVITCKCNVLTRK